MGRPRKSRRGAPGEGQPSLFGTDEFAPPVRLRRSKARELAKLNASAVGQAPLDRLYQAQGLVLCTLPYRQVTGVFRREAVLHQSTDRKVVVQTDLAPLSKDAPVPFGRDRLLLVWLVTRARNQQSRFIQFTRTEFLEDMRGVFDPEDTEGFAKMAERVLNAALTFRKIEWKPNTHPYARKKWMLKDKTGATYRLFAFHKEKDGAGEDKCAPLHPWRVKGPSGEVIYQVEVSDEFFNDLDIARAVPMSMDVIRRFARSPKALDLAWFVSWRSYGLARAAQRAIDARREAGEDLTPEDEEALRQTFEARIPWGRNGPVAELGPRVDLQPGGEGLRDMFGSADKNDRQLRRTMAATIEDLRREWWADAQVWFDGTTLVIRPPLNGTFLV